MPDILLPSAGQTKRKKKGFLLFRSLKPHAVTSIQIINNFVHSFSEVLLNTVGTAVTVLVGD